MPEETARLVEGIREYWRSDHWQRFLHLLQEEDGEHIYHIHHSVDTCVHPESMMLALQFYFARQGWEIDREVDVFALSPKPMGTLHGVCPKGMPHFDFIWRYKPEVVLAPMAPDGTKENLSAWGENYMREFYSKFPFRSVGSKEEAEIEAWFRSPQWERACKLVEDPKVVHVHANVVSSVHPDAVAAAALRAFKREGWTVWDYEPCAYDVRGVMTGKTVFMLSYPQQVFDIAWRFDPDVVLGASPKPFMFDDDPWFDWRTQDDMPKLLALGDYVKLPRATLHEAVS